MPEESGKHAGGEDDLFDRWLAHRDDEAAGGRLRTVPPQWAPRVVTPAADPLTDPLTDPLPTEPVVVDEPLAEPAVVAEPVLAEAVVLEEPAAVDEPVAIEPVVIDEPAIEPAPLEQPIAAEVIEHVDEPPTDEIAHPDVPPPAPAVMAPTDGTPPLRMTFAPRTRARTAVGVGTLLAAAAAVIGCYVASRERDLPSIGIAATLWVLTGIIWAVHSGTSVTRMSVRGGQLQVQQHGVRTTFDLTSTYTPVEVHGRPGKHGWKVVFRRRDMSAFVIDQTMVDPTEFMRVLRYYRPGIDAGTGPRAAL
jgi:hypothetical protein